MKFYQILLAILLLTIALAPLSNYVYADKTYRVTIRINTVDAYPPYGSTAYIYDEGGNLINKQWNGENNPKLAGVFNFYLMNGAYEVVVTSYSMETYWVVKKFIVEGNQNVTVNVRELSSLTFLRYIDPIEGREREGTLLGSFIIPSERKLGEFFFQPQVPHTEIYLQRDLTYTFGYYNYYYLLFVKDVKITAPFTEVLFNCSDTGLLDAVFQSPSGDSQPYGYECIILNEDLPTMSHPDGRISFDYHPIATSTGTYDSIMRVRYYIEEEYYFYDFLIEEVNVEVGHNTTVNYGGVINGSIRTAKSRYMVGENPAFIIDLKDAYSHSFMGVGYDFEYIINNTRPHFNKLVHYKVYADSTQIRQGHFEWIDYNYDEDRLETSPMILPKAKPGVYRVDFTFALPGYQNNLELSTTFEILSVGDLKVIVKDSSGAVISGASVSSSSQPSGQSALMEASGADGGSTFSGVLPGTYTLQASKDGFTSSSGTVSVVAGVTAELAITLEAVPTKGDLKVIIKDSSGAAVSGVSVSFSSQPSGQSALSGTSANDGSVTFTGLAVGNYTLQVSKSSYVSGSVKGVVKAGSQTELTSTLQAQPSGGIPGFPIVFIIVGVLLSVALLWFNECRTRLRDV
jgi:hypothetical protein